MKRFLRVIAPLYMHASAAEQTAGELCEALTVLNYDPTMSASWLLATRASDAERERTVQVLREAAVQGRLSHDSFVGRIDLALVARNRDDLWDLVADLDEWTPPRQLDDRTPAFGRRRRYPLLRLPSSSGPMIIGRRRDCDIVIEDISVSRVHAVLIRYDDTWVLADHGSTNGTCVNGDSLGSPVAVFPGDLVAFGLATLQLAGTTQRPVSKLWSVHSRRRRTRSALNL